MNRLTKLATVLLMAEVAGCTWRQPSEGGEMTLEAVEPDLGDIGAAMPVVVRGTHFRVAAQANYRDNDGSKLDARFTATLGDTALESVTFVGESELSAVVPGTLARGVYALTVRSPTGESATLEDAFHVGCPSPAIWYRDGDGDGYGEIGAEVTACSGPAGYVAASGDCDDGNPDINPGADETCDGAGVDENCDSFVDEACPCDFQGSTLGVCATAIRDASGTCGAPFGYEVAELSCDGADNDCDGATDEGCPCDYQGSTLGVCATAIRDASGNCAAPAGYEVAELSCDAADNDCDGATDEGCSCDYQGSTLGVCATAIRDASGHCAAPPGYEVAELSCDGADNDCDGATDEGCPCDYLGSAAGVCATAVRDDTGGCAVPPGYEAAESTCDGADNDCDGATDEGCSCDYQGSTLGVCATAIRDASGNCAAPAGYEVAELSCDGADNDCNGATDEGCPCDYLGSAAGVCATAVRDDTGTCAVPPGYEGAETTCDGADNDCDGATDEGCPCNYLGSSIGVCATAVRDSSGGCTAPATYEATETSCDTLDNDCDSALDEGCGVIGCYSYRRPIVIDYTKVGVDNVGTLPATGFPVLVSLSGTWLRTAAADPTNGRIQNASGWDIAFTAADGTTPLYHEIETYDGTNGILVAWVRIDSVSKSADTTFYVYYGNASLTSPTENPPAVWDGNYMGVWHLKEADIDGGSGDIRDSTRNANNGTTQGGMTPGDQVPGKVDGSFDFDGTDDQVSVGDKGTLNIRSALTMETWVDASAYSASWNDVIGKGVYDWYTEKGKICQYYETDAGTYDNCPGTYTMVAGTWYHVVATYSNGSIKSYVNGTLDGTASNGTTINDAIGNDFLIAFSSLGGPIRFQGKLDEVRISNTARDADWIRTEYNNQSDTVVGAGHFVKSLGGEEVVVESPPASGACVGWYDASWTHRKKLVIDHTMVAADLSNFPVLVSWTADAGLAAAARPDGWDVVFTASDGWTKLDHEIESYVGSTGAMVAWVRIPRLSSVLDTELYVYFGNGVATDQQNETGVWAEGGSNHYKGVWHLAEDPSVAGTGGIRDSTLNRHDGTDMGGMTSLQQVAGMMGGSLRFDNNAYYVDFGAVSDFDFGTSNYTASLWVNGQAVDEAYVTKSDYWGPYSGVYFYKSTSNNSYAYYTGSYVLFGEDGADGAWHHLVIVRAGIGANQLLAYLDGSPVATATDGRDLLNDRKFMIHRWNDTASYNSGAVIDEVRVSNTNRSAAWIQTEYNNQVNQGVGPGKFILSSEEK